MVNKRVRNAVLGCNLKNDRRISSPLDKNPVPGHLSELHPVNEVNTKGQFSSLREQFTLHKFVM